MLLKFESRALLIFFRLVVNLHYTRAARGHTLRAFYTRSECYINDTQLVPVFSCGLEGPNEANLRLSARLLLSRDINNLTVHWRFAVNRGGRWDTYIATELDVCFTLGHLQSNFLLRMITEQVRQHGNIPLQCPLKQGVEYFLKNFTIDSGALPPYIPELDWASLANFHVDGRKVLIVNTFGKVMRVATSRKKILKS